VGKDFQYKIPIKRNWNKYKNQTILSPYYQVNLGILDIIKKYNVVHVHLRTHSLGDPTTPKDPDP